MKFAKLSLAALAVVGFSSSAMALDLSGVTAKPYVNTKLYYETVKTKNDGTADSKFFKQGNSSGQALAQAGVTGNFNSCWGYGLEYSVADTLGLENNLVSNTRMGYGRTSLNRDHNASNTTVDKLTDTQDWMSQAYITFKGCGTPLKNTTFKIGRQYLDTPLAFTETWNLAPNSFDAIVAVNSDIQNVTLVGAYVGKGNGTFGRVTNGDRFDTYVQKGAYAAGILTNFGVPVNLWYYNVREVAKAWWADANINLMNVAKLGLQYGSINPNADGADNTKGGAIKLSGNIAGFDLSAAYSKIDKDGVIALANTATLKTYKDDNGEAYAFGGKKTKLATAGIYTDGTGVAIPDSKAYRIAASTKTPIGKFTLAYVDCKNDSTKAAALEANAPVSVKQLASDTNVKEVDAILGTKVLGINTKLIYINRNFTEGANKDHDKQHVRIILSKKF